MKIKAKKNKNPKKKGMVNKIKKKTKDVFPKRPKESKKNTPNSQKKKVDTLGKATPSKDEPDVDPFSAARGNLIRLLSGKRKGNHLLPISSQARSRDLTDLSWRKLKAARFRQVNESLYTMRGDEAKEMLSTDPSTFEAYHEGYRQQVESWPINPLDVIVEELKSMPVDLIVADFGCGEGKLALSIPQEVHSFDLVSTAQHVIACDIKRTPLKPKSVNVVVFCLSLMGKNLGDYILEANRVLKPKGILKIAEVESRFLGADGNRKSVEKGVDKFCSSLKPFGFKLKSKSLERDLFVFLTFKKIFSYKAVDDKGRKKVLPELALKPCLYKKR